MKKSSVIYCPFCGRPIFVGDSKVKLFKCGHCAADGQMRVSDKIKKDKKPFISVYAHVYED